MITKLVIILSIVLGGILFSALSNLYEGKGFKFSKDKLTIFLVCAVFWVIGLRIGNLLFLPLWGKSMIAGFLVTLAYILKDRILLIFRFFEKEEKEQNDRNR